MFADAIEKVGAYTRALHIIRRRFGDNAIFADCGTLFFVNDQGDALTAKHVAAAIPAADQMEKKYRQFLAERAALKQDERCVLRRSCWNVGTDTARIPSCSFAILLLTAPKAAQDSHVSFIPDMIWR